MADVQSIERYTKYRAAARASGYVHDTATYSEEYREPLPLRMLSIPATSVVGVSGLGADVAPFLRASDISQGKIVIHGKDGTSWVLSTETAGGRIVEGVIGASPFDFIDNPGTEEQRIEKYIAEIEGSADIPFSAQIAERLRELVEIVSEEFPGDEIFAEASVSAFIAFLKRNRNINVPSILRTPNGNVRIQWRRDRESLFVIEFYSDEKCGFVIFTPENGRPGKPIRISGYATPRTVMSVAEPHAVMEWSLQA